ncbi:acyltransferase [Niveibacterium sp. SC-1]|uniref:acyltransferase n=1 Tax=Niveibacterium sp. SC-1 TaxID=3135646 RepID=UPI00311E4B9E
MSLISRALSGLRGCVAACVLVLNLVLVFGSMIPVALVKLVLPFAPVRRITDRILNAQAELWISINGAWISAGRRLDWQITGLEGLRRNGWYLVSCNHQSWVDILILQRSLNRRIPLLKFFLKRELIYVPIIGLAWWALDFPFMRRKGGKSAKDDIAATRRACEKFRLVPTSLTNFLEGTRFSPAKHKQQRSPYRHLLKPRAGGLAIALATMGDQFDAMLDITIVYPDGVPTFWALLSGRVQRVRMEVRERRIPPEMLIGDYERDAAFRATVQAWIHDVWQQKDQRIDELLASVPGART